jgi:predicted nucleic acid-binding protein
MRAVEFGADTSVFARLNKPVVAARFASLAATARVAICAPVAFEIGYLARGNEDYVAITDRLASFPSLPMTDADHRRALEVRCALAVRGQHRALSLVDALVAAAAEARELTVLHYDSDFELVAEVTGQRHQWIVARGTAD